MRLIYYTGFSPKRKALKIFLFSRGSRFPAGNARGHHCGGTGLVLGLVALYAGMPEFPATDPITAAAVGVVSGLAATGINQAVKQLGKTE